MAALRGTGYGLLGSTVKINRPKRGRQNPDLFGIGLGDGGGRSLVATLRLNTMLTSLELGFNGLGEGGERVMAEALRPNSTLTSLDLSSNDLGVKQKSALRQARR